MKSINEAMKEFELNEAKTLAIPDTNIEIKKIAMDTNGNKTIYFIRGNKNQKIQTNGNMPKTHSMGLYKTFSQLKKLSDEQLKTIGNEIEAYYKEIGESKNPLVNPDRKDKKIEEAKSAEASMVLRLMDSEWNDELSFQKLVDIISIATDTDKKKLAKELDQYV